MSDSKNYKNYAVYVGTDIIRYNGEITHTLEDAIQIVESFKAKMRKQQVLETDKKLREQAEWKHEAIEIKEIVLN